MYNITFICSHLCGGKSHLAQSLKEAKFWSSNTPAIVVEVGEIVRILLQKERREECQAHPELDKEIIKQISKVNQTYDNVIVVGARQVQILRAFPQAHLIWIDNPPKLLYQRWLLRDEKKDNGEKTYERFQELLYRDIELGVEEVKHYIINTNAKQL